MRLTLEDIIAGIQPLDPAALEQARAHTAQLVMPPRALGRLHEIGERLCGIQGTLTPAVRGKAVLVMAGDHGIVAEGISAFPQSVTGAMIATFLAGGAGINALARQAGAEVWVADLGAIPDIETAELKNRERLLVRKVGRGTRNFAREAAMTRAEAATAVLHGFELASGLIRNGADLLGTGDMGIGNTTPSAAIGSVLTGRSVEEMVGRGTGIDDLGLARKREAIRRGIERQPAGWARRAGRAGQGRGVRDRRDRRDRPGRRLSPQGGRDRRVHLDRRGPRRPRALPARDGFHVCRPLLGGTGPPPHAAASRAAADPRPGAAPGRGHGGGARHGRDRRRRAGHDRGDDLRGSAGAGKQG